MSFFMSIESAEPGYIGCLPSSDSGMTQTYRTLVTGPVIWSFVVTKSRPQTANTNMMAPTLHQWLSRCWNNMNEKLHLLGISYIVWQIWLEKGWIALFRRVSMPFSSQQHTTKVDSTSPILDTVSTNTTPWSHYSLYFQDKTEEMDWLYIAFSQSFLLSSLKADISEISKQTKLKLHRSLFLPGHNQDLLLQISC